MSDYNDSENYESDREKENGPRKQITLDQIIQEDNDHSIQNFGIGVASQFMSQEKIEQHQSNIQDKLKQYESLKSQAGEKLQSANQQFQAKAEETGAKLREKAYSNLDPQQQKILQQYEQAAKQKIDDVAKQAQNDIEAKAQQIQQDSLKKAQETSNLAQNTIQSTLNNTVKQLQSVSNTLNEQTANLNVIAPILVVTNPEAAKQIQGFQKGLNQTNKFVQQGSQQATQQINRQSVNVDAQFTKVNKNLEKNPTLSKSSIQIKESQSNSVLTQMKNAINDSLAKKEMKRLVSEASIERKSAVFGKLKAWELYRDNSLLGHRRILETVFERLERRSETSDHSVQHLIKIYQQRTEFEEQNSKYYSQQNGLQKLFKEQEEKNVLVHYPAFTQGLSQIDEIHLQKSKDIDTLVVFLKSQQIEVLGQERENFLRNVQAMKDGYHRLKKKVNESLEQAQKQWTKHVENYNESIQMHMKFKNFPKDTYNSELKYKEIVYQLLEDQRVLGKFMMENWYTLLRLETQRLQVIQKSLCDVQAQYTVVYGKHKYPDQIVTILQNIDVLKECEEFWGSKSLLKQTEWETIKNYFKKEVITIKEVKEYLENISLFEDDTSHPLILKSLTAFKDIGIVGKSWKIVNLIVTVDQNILIFDDPKEGQYKKADMVMQIAGIKMNQLENGKIDKNMVEIKYVKPGLLLDSKKKLLLKFNSSDDLEEINYFLQTVAQNKFVTDISEDQQ